jgi:flagellar motility protein MotE (MotC chaperone)
MKWEKQELTEIDEMLQALNSLKGLAKDKLKTAQEKLTVITNEMPEYIEIYKKMKGE